MVEVDVFLALGVAVGEMGVHVNQARHDEERAVVEDTVMHGNRGSIRGVADEGDATVVADADRDVVADRAGVTGEEGATADMGGHGASSGLNLAARCLLGAHLVVG